MNWKKAAAVILAAALAAAPGAQTFAAANTHTVYSGSDAFGTPSVTKSVINTDLTGSIMLHKIIENDGQNIEADGADGTSGSGLSTTDGTYDDSGTPVSDVLFSYLKIADIVSVSGTVSAGADASQGSYQGVGTYFQLTDAGRAMFAAAGYPVSSITSVTIDGETYYRTSDLENALAAINNRSTDGSKGEESINSYLAANGTNFAETDAAGTTRASSLPLGLYLVGETDISAHDGKVDADTIQNHLMRSGDAMYNENVLSFSGSNVVVKDATNGKEYTYSMGDYYTDNSNPEGPVINTLASPFLVSLPSTNIADLTVGGTTYPAGTAWVYDQNVYPKDQTVSIKKKIVDPDESGDRTLRDYEDYQIGDTVEQVIWADAPELQDGYSLAVDQDTDTGETATNKKQYESYAITDDMTEGLTIKDVTQVRIIDKVADPTDDKDFLNSGIKLAASDYTVSKDADGHGFTVTLTSAGLTKLNGISKNSQVVVYFDSVVNSDAVIGSSDSNENHPTLTWKTTSSSEKSVKGNHVYVFTYEIDLVKDGLSDPTTAAFVVARENGTASHKADGTIATGTDDDRTDKAVQEADNTANGKSNASTVASTTFDKTAGRTLLTFVRESKGVYHLYDEINDAGASAGEMWTEDGGLSGTTADGNMTNVLRPASDGKFDVKGVDADSIYTLKEVKTLENGLDSDNTDSENNDHNLLKSVIDIQLTATSSLVDKLDSSNQDLVVDKSAGHANDVAYHRVTGNAAATATVYNGSSSDSTNLSHPDDTNGGIVGLEIDNYKSVMLRTGGEGRVMIYVIGGAMAAMMVGAFLISKKRRENEDAVEE